MEQGGEALTSAFTPLEPGTLLAESVVLPETWEQPPLYSSCGPTAFQAQCNASSCLVIWSLA